MATTPATKSASTSRRVESAISTKLVVPPIVKFDPKLKRIAMALNDEGWALWWKQVIQWMAHVRTTCSATAIGGLLVFVMAVSEAKAQCKGHYHTAGTRTEMGNGVRAYFIPITPESFRTRKRPRENLNSDDHFDRSFSFIALDDPTSTKHENKNS
jgi:hypothetical protein